MAEINDQMQSILLKQILNTKLPEEQEDQGALSLSSLGVKTLDVRMKKHEENAIKVAEFLNSHR